MSKRKKVIFFVEILVIISLIVTLFSIKSTYAKYYEKISTNYNIGMKKWLIKIDDYDIISENNWSQIIKPTLIRNANVNYGVLAPTSSGYFDITVDFLDVNVPFKIEFSIEQLNQNKLSDLRLEYYDGDDNELQLPIIVNPEEADSSVLEIKVKFIWYDGEDGNMDDEADTNFEGEDALDNNGVINYKLNATFKQVIL